MDEFKKVFPKANLPRYEMVLSDDENETGIRSISLVGEPAIEIKGMVFNKIGEFEITPEFIDSLNEDELLYVLDMFWTQPWEDRKDKSKGKLSKVPLCHPNCHCEIKNGKWEFGVCDDGSINPCLWCQDNKRRFDLQVKGAGAPKSGGFAKLEFNIVKTEANDEFKFTVDKEKQMIFGPTMIPNIDIFRRDENGDEYYVVFSKEIIEEAAMRFFKKNNNRSINLEHTNQMVPAYICESWIVKDDYYDTSRFYGFNLPIGSHFIGLKVEDEAFWKSEVKDNGKFGFSIEGVLGKKIID